MYTKHIEERARQKGREDGQKEGKKEETSGILSTL